MAELKERFSENVSGKYYVDTTCVRCALCHDMAPEHFTSNDSKDGFVFAQPTNPQEEAHCKSAQEHCPVSAIGSDGELN